MKFFFGLVSFVALNVFTGSLFACDIDGKTGIVEDNNLYIGTDEKSVSSVTEEDFNDVIDKLSAIYEPIVSSKGGQLKVERKWSDGTVNAYAQRTGSVWQVSMFGGLARHQAITKDAFALVLCHEIGHHLGGAPKKKSMWFANWATNEGQADYFGNLKCMRKYVENDNNVALMKNVNIPSFVSEKCQANFNHEEDIAICERTSMAGLSLGNLFRDLRKLDVDLSFSTPDKSIVKKTYDGHPEPQCRLDTYFAGSICNKDKEDEVSDTDENEGVCSKAEGDTSGLRPLCWFKPGNI